MIHRFSIHFKKAFFANSELFTLNRTEISEDLNNMNVNAIKDLKKKTFSNVS